LSGLHGILGHLAVAAAALAAILAGLATLALAHRSWGVALARLTDLLAVVLAVLVLAALFIGGLLLITGLRPSSPAHIILAVAALAAMPLAGGVALWREQGEGRGPQRYLWIAGGAIVTGVLGLLLAVSG
jgi:hypothetical protein